MSKFIIEKAEDLTTNRLKTPFSFEIQKMWQRFSSKNIILDNGQMILLKCEDDIITNISDYFNKILIEFIQSEENLNDCYDIKDRYASNIDHINNTNKFVKKICDIIVNMDRVYKYVWNIAKILNDDMDSYNKFLLWQKDKIKINNNVSEGWNLIYSLRNEIEHPQKMKTTFFKRTKSYIILPKAIVDSKEYDLLELGEKALLYAFILSKSIISASFLYSKYVTCFTDESRTKLYSVKN